MAKKIVHIDKHQAPKVASLLGDTAVAKVPVKVVAETEGPVTFVQKLQGYYKGLIAAIGSLLIIINEVTPLLNFLPGQDKHYVDVAIAVLTTAATFLKSNEHWLDDL